MPQIKLILIAKDGTETELKPLESAYDYLLARGREKWALSGGAAIIGLVQHFGITPDPEILNFVVTGIGALLIALPTSTQGKP